MITSILISGPQTLWEKKRNELVQRIQQIKSSLVRDFLESIDFSLLTPNEKGTLGIEEIRILDKQLSIRPLVYPLKIFQINSAEKMTIPAQNAFLKNLEEHPDYTVIILCTINFNLLLPTIVSRCEKVLLFSVDLPTDEKSLQLTEENLAIIFDQSALGKKFKLAEEQGKDKDYTINFLDQLITDVRTILLFSASATQTQSKFTDFSKQKLISLIRNCEQTKTYLQANVNPRFALENLFLSC
ncbi:MAG: hypothetical protein ACD_12C00395G0002 [uncultured bacterium]|nr:MAG: hypothetical protein ACD_12C00395G0002 [uncultured bacterium]